MIFSTWWNSRIIVLFSIKLENDDIQDFDLRWQQALLLTSDPLSDKVLEGLYVNKLQDSSQALTVWHCTLKFCEEEDNEIITDSECVWSCMLNKLEEVKKFRTQSEIPERVAVTFTKRKTG